MDQDRILQAIAESYNSLRTEISALRVDVIARIDRLQDAVTAMRSDAFVSFQRSDRVEKAADNTREELNHTRQELRALIEEVSGMHKQIYRLQTDIRRLKGESE
jgi:uncharacterized coiled-coil DUF342 family protein